MSARPFTEQEYSLLTASLTDQGRLRDKLIVVLSCATGFRIKEVLSLTIGQVCDAATAEVVREVTIARRNMKGGRGLWQRSVRGRRVPLGEPVRQAIRDYLVTLGVLDAGTPHRGTRGDAPGNPSRPSPQCLSPACPRFALCRSYVFAP